MMVVCVRGTELRQEVLETRAVQAGVGLSQRAKGWIKAGESWGPNRIWEGLLWGCPACVLELLGVP